MTEAAELKAAHLLKVGDFRAIEFGCQRLALPGVGSHMQLVDDAAGAGVTQQPHHLPLERPQDA